MYAFGNVVSGDVTLRFREYHDALDVFLSGIPMDYTCQGEKRNFQTAGMFEIRAKQNDRKLQLAGGKQIEVGLVSTTGDPGYNVFSFDESRNKWVFLDYSQPVVNLEKEAIEKRINSMKSVCKVPFDNDFFVLNYGSFLDVYLNFDRQKIWRNLDNPVYKNKAKKYGLKMYDLINGGNVFYKGKEYPAQSMVWKNLSGRDFPRYQKGNHCEVRQIKGNVYSITHYYWYAYELQGMKPFTIRAEIVMPLRELFARSSKKWEKEYKQYQIDLAREEKRLAMETEFYRNIKISGFGIFNYDMIRKRDNMLVVEPKFKIEGMEQNARFSPKKVFCFVGNNTVIEVRTDWKEKLYLDPQEKNFRIIAILNDNRVALFTPEQYHNINFDFIRSSGNPFYIFDLKKQEALITSKEDLQKLIGS